MPVMSLLGLRVGAREWRLQTMMTSSRVPATISPTLPSSWWQLKTPSVFVKLLIDFYYIQREYAVKAQTSLAPLSRFRGSRITTAHEQQCCRFQSYAKICAIANEVDKRNWQSVNHIPGIHDNGPRDQSLWRLTSNSVLDLGRCCWMNLNIFQSKPIPLGSRNLTLDRSQNPAPQSITREHYGSLLSGRTIWSNHTSYVASTLHPAIMAGILEG